MSKDVPHPSTNVGIPTRFRWRSIAVIVTAVILLGAIAQVHVVRVEQVCSGLKAWHLTLRDDDQQHLPLAAGVYTAKTFSFSNAFGLAGKSAVTILVRPEGNP